MVKGQEKNVIVLNPSQEGKVIEMPLLATKTTSREEKLLKARKLSSEITKKTKNAGISHEDIVKEVKKAFNDVKASRRSGRN